MITDDPQTRSTPADRSAEGKQARSRRPRSAIGGWAPSDDRPDPIERLEDQARSRVQELLPIRYGRMAASPFAFYRGAATVMAWDLGTCESTGLQTQLCGDAHLSNFGGFGAPDRRLVFDLNDFDETHPGPFEWDLQRLAASIEIAARSLGIEPATRAATVRRMSASYRTAMREFAAMSDLDVWYQPLDADALVQRFGQGMGAAVLKQYQKTVQKAERKDRYRALARLTTRVDGELRFVSDPPLLVPGEEVFTDVAAEELDRTLREVLVDYLDTLPYHHRRLVDGYTYLRFARKVVGVGSVGSRAWVLLLLGRDDGDPLFLQVKQAEASVLEPFTAPSELANHGQRVVAGQSIMQAASDVFLGWDRVTGLDGVERDYYVRQLWDWKASADVATMRPDGLAVYGEICGWTLARAHARSGDRIAIASYLGGGDTFDRALADFATTYADLNERDHARLVAAIDAGTIAAQAGV